MKRLGIIFGILLLSIPAFAAQIVTATVTVTNTAGTTNGQTITVNSNVRTWTNSVASAATQILTNSTIGGAATNLFRHVASTMFANLTLSLSGTNGINLGTAPNGALSVSLSAGWGSVVLTTNTIGPGGAVVNVPYTINGAAQQTNLTSGIVAMVDADVNTNVIREAAPAMANFVGKSNTQTVTGTKTFNAANTYSNASQVISGGTVTNVSIKNAVTISGTVSSLTNGGYYNPSLTNAINYGNAFRSPGSASLSEQFGSGATATAVAASAFGYGASSTNIGGTALGTIALAGGAGATAIGSNARALELASTALGPAAVVAVGHTNSTALGVGSTTTTSNQVRLGTSAEWVSAPGNLTVDGSISNITAAGMANFPAGSDIAFGRYSLSTLANGNNAGIVVGTNVFVEVSGPTAAFSINGISAGRNGKLLVLVNQTSKNMTFANESGVEPTAANRLVTMTGDDITAAGNRAAWFIYSTAAARWLMVGLGAGSTVITNVPAGTISGGGLTNNFDGFWGNGIGLTNLQWTNIVGAALSVSNFYQTNIFYASNVTFTEMHGKITVVSNVFATNIFVTNIYAGSILVSTGALDNLTVTNGITNSAATASTIANWDANKKLGSLANGGNNTVIHGTTPPAYSAVVEADHSFSDVTTGDVSTSKHGYAPKAPGDSTKFLNGDNPPAWAVPSIPGNVLTNGESVATAFSNSVTVYGALTNTGYSKFATSVVDRIVMSDGGLYRFDSSTIRAISSADALTTGFRGYDLTFDNRLYHNGTTIISENNDVAGIRDITLSRILQNTSSAGTYIITYAGATGTDAAPTGGLEMYAAASTGTGRGGQLILGAANSTTTGSSANGRMARYVLEGKHTALTHTTATRVFNVTVASGKHVGFRVSAETYSTDGSAKQVTTDDFTVSAFNIAGTVSAGITVTPLTSTVASSGTLTTVWTAVANGNSVDIKCAATSSVITPTTLQARYQLEIMGDDFPTVAP